MKRRIAVFGGTFDPIHNGHLRLALAFAEQLALDKVLLMPSSVPPHKIKPDLADAAHRLQMCRLAAEPHPVLEVCDIEIARGGASYTADTLEQVQAMYPDAQLYLITGADMFLTLGTWKRFDSIARTAVLCAAPRGEVTVQQLRQYAARLEQSGARCAVLDVPLYTVSSTQLRQDLCGIDRLVPETVARYIRDNGLYRTRGEGDVNAQYMQILQGRLTPARYDHSLAVARQARLLASRLGADEEKAYTAGLLHDILKDTDADTLLQMLHDFGILVTAVEKHTPQLLHAMAGAAFLERILGITDREMLDAVRYHTTGRADMSPLETAVFLADFTSDDRTYPDVEVMRHLVLTDTDEAIRYAVAYTIKDLTERKRMIHPDTVALYNQTIGRQQG